MDQDVNIQKIHRRQLARLLYHLNVKGRLTPELEKDLKRSFNFVFEDVQASISTQENDKENNNDGKRT